MSKTLAELISEVTVNTKYEDIPQYALDHGHFFPAVHSAGGRGLFASGGL